MSKVSYKTVRGKILDGIQHSTRLYKSWSNDWPFYYAPEYLMTIEIARKIRGIRKWELWTTPEWSVRETLSEAKGMRQGRPESALRLQGRYDIVVWRANNTPRFVIEVKHRVVGFSQIKDDVSRICTAFKNPKLKMQCGFIVFWSEAYEGREGDARIMINKRVEKIFDQVSSDASEVQTMAPITRQLSWKQDYASAAVLIQFNRANK